MTDRKYKVGLIGCGNIFTMHSVPIRESDYAVVAAVCDNKKDRADKCAEEYNVKAYYDYRKMIDEEDLDVVHVLTPHYLHPEMAVYAAEKGINVMTEKPMSIKLVDAEKMVAAAKDNNVTLGVIFQNRYNEGSVMVKDHLETGTLGKILGGKLSVTWKRPDEYYSLSDWKGTWDKEGGGVIIDQSIHTLDLMRWLVDDDIEYIEANIGNRAHNIIQVEDSAEGVIKFKSGINIGFYTINYYSYDAPVEIELHCENGIAKIIGSSAHIKLNDSREYTTEMKSKKYSGFGKNFKGYWGVSHTIQIDNYYKALSNGAEPEISGEEALKTQKMICAIYDSGKQNKRIVY